MAITSISKLLITRRTDGGGLLPIVTPTTRLGASSISSVSGVSLGFTFTFDGVDYTTCYLSAFGFLRLAGTVTSSSNANLFSASTNVVLAPWWDGMRTNSVDGYLKTEVQGTAPWRRFVAQWRNYLASGHTSTNNDTVEFQVILYETSNKVEFRYGARARTGSPSTGSASAGFKGVTTVVATNYRDLSTDALTLGGSSSTRATTLTYVDYDALVGMVQIEPNWPMVGRWVSVGREQLTGLQHPQADPLWAFANNLHWLYCRWTPALLNLAPVQYTPHPNPVCMAPVTPSADGLTYRVWIESYTTGGGTISCDVRTSTLSAPQPATGAHWSAGVTATEVGTAAGYHSWTAVTLTLASTVTFLRFAFTGSVLVLNILVAPVPLDDFDPAATYPSSWAPVGLGQIRQQGAAVHPEIFNRLWKSVGYLAADRYQAVWSLSFPNFSDYFYSPTTALRVRTLGFAPASLAGWRGQTVDAQVYGLDTTDGGRGTFQELGGRSVDLTLDDNGGEVRLDEDTLELIGETPSVLFQVDPLTSSRLMFAGLRWRPPFSTDDLIAGVTPAPRLEDLLALHQRLERAFRAWAQCGLAVKLGEADAWVVSWLVPPATDHLECRIARSGDGTGGPSTETSIVATTSGAGAADEILVPSAADGDEVWPPEDGALSVIVTSRVIDDAPAAAMDRLLESPTAAQATQAVRERVEVHRGVGVCITTLPVDVATL